MHGIFYRIDAETEVAYKLIAEPVQKPSAEEPKPGEVVDQAPEEATNTANLQGCVPADFEEICASWIGQPLPPGWTVEWAPSSP